MRVGFTGTREGTTNKQFGALMSLIDDLDPHEVHHGCAVGADEEFTIYVRACEVARVVGHPGDTLALTSKDALRYSHEVLPTKPNLERNRDIVDAVDLLLVCPRTMKEEQRSGTWACCRYARKQHKPIRICWPDGTVTGEG